MDDPELEQIRAKRLAEAQQQGGNEGGTTRQDQQKKAAREEEMKNSILSQVLDQDARARLSNIAMAKPEKAQRLEGMIIQMARYGQIAGKLTDEQFKSLLDRVAEQAQKGQTTVKFDRRRAAIDSDED